MQDVKFSYVVACSTCGRTTRMVYSVPLDTCVRLTVPRTWDSSGGEVACGRCLRQWEKAAQEEAAKEDLECIEAALGQPAEPQP